MADATGFDLDQALDHLIGADSAQKKNDNSNKGKEHARLKQAVEELAEEKDFTIEEAFAVIKARHNGSQYFSGQSKAITDENLHLKKITLLFAGVVICFIAYYLVILSSELYFLIINHINDNSTELNINRLSLFIKSTYITIAGVLIILFFMDHIVVNFLSRFRFKSSTAFLLVIMLMILIYTEKLLTEQIFQVVENGIHRGVIYKKMENIRFIYNAILGVGFLILYFRYTKKALVP